MTINPHGIFITLEGIEGSGKTTQLPAVVDYLSGRQWDCVVSREPGGTAIGQAIRKILLDPHSRGMDATAELLLYMADRAQHIGETIRPALAGGKAVICDRYTDATEAYQGYARGLDLELIRTLHTAVLNPVIPDLTLLFDLPPRVGLARAWQRIGNDGRESAESRFEEESLRFHHRVREGYLSLARLAPHRFRVIDAAGRPAEVREQIIAALADFTGMHVNKTGHQRNQNG